MQRWCNGDLYAIGVGRIFRDQWSFGDDGNCTCDCASVVVVVVIIVHCGGGVGGDTIVCSRANIVVCGTGGSEVSVERQIFILINTPRTF